MAQFVIASEATQSTERRKASDRPKLLAMISKDQ
jgi:hypothetical protein